MLLTNYAESHGYPLGEQERTILTDCDKRILQQCGTTLLGTTLIGSTLLSYTLKRFNIVRPYLLSIPSSLGIGCVLSLYTLATNIAPYCYHRVVYELPPNNKLRQAAFNTMLEYNPAYANAIIQKLQQQKQNQSINSTGNNNNATN